MARTVRPSSRDKQVLCADLPDCMGCGSPVGKRLAHNDKNFGRASPLAALVPVTRGGPSRRRPALALQNIQTARVLSIWPAYVDG